MLKRRTNMTTHALPSRLTLAMTLFVVLTASACDEAAEQSAPQQPAPLEAGKQARVTKESGKAEEGPDCATYLSEVKHACRAHYQRGLDVDCYSLITAANIAIKQRGGELFTDTTGKNPTAAERAGDMLCKRNGARLREAVVKAASTTPAPGCVELGSYLDARCFEKIGAAAYDDNCAGPIMVTRKVDSDEACKAQLGAAQQLLK